MLHSLGIPDRIIDKHYDYINKCIDKVFRGEKVDILRINKKL